MTWKYKVIHLGSGDDAEDESLLNDLGKDGWELVSVQWGPDDDYYLRAFLKKSEY
jgi:hypothetical protein